ncbi:MAG TPA: SH3 domain-containing protein [Methyloceanibacter sp.]|nr:SH3 domain-containing protein [Methyloceanibacter sp.]
MSKLLKIGTAASTAILVGGLAIAPVDRGAETQSLARQHSSLILAVAPPHRSLTTDPAVDLAPSLPKTPPLPERSPAIPTVDMASAQDDTFAMNRAVMTKPAMVRAGASASAPALYGFPAGRTLRVVAMKDGFVQIEDVRSGADGWVEKSALASNMMTASVERKPVRQAKADIESPKPVTGIPKEERYSPMLLGGGETETTPRRTASGANFASFVRRGFGAN